MAKEFADVINARTRGNRVKDSISQATGGAGKQTDAAPEERAKREADGRTQGRKGCKLARINMAFTSENYLFIKTVARLKGMNLTEFVNYIVEDYREQHAEAYEKAKAVSEEF